MQDGIERAFVNILGLRTFYARAGAGVPLVMVHGGSPGASTMVNWKLNIAPLAKAGFAIYAFDQPGFGDTDVPADHSMEFRVAHAQAFVQAMKFDRFHICGNSMGAYIGARIALENNGVDRLVFVSSATLAPRGSDQAAKLAASHVDELKGYQPTLEHMRAMTQKTLYNQALVDDELVRARFEMSSGARYDAMLARQKTPPARSLVPELGKIDRKTLILWGANDHGAAVERAVLLFNALPDAELHIFNHCAHWVHWDQADRFNRLVIDFLGRG